MPGIQLNILKHYVPQHPSVKQSFFIKFLLFTSIAGNIYLVLQSLCHTFNFHELDVYVRWYPFKAAPAYNLVLLIGACLTLLGAIKIRNNGLSSFKIYFIGKFITLLAIISLTMLEYRASNIPYPYLLIPILVAIETIYPLLLYISLRKKRVA